MHIGQIAQYPELTLNNQTVTMVYFRSASCTGYLAVYVEKIRFLHTAEKGTLFFVNFRKRRSITTIASALFG